MFTPIAPLRALAILLTALALSSGLALPSSSLATLRTEQPNALTISVPPFIIFGIGNPQGGIVNYLPSVVVSDPNAQLECTPGTGYFTRGSHTISCVATLGAERATAEFFLLVAYDDDTDVALTGISSLPTSPMLPASLVEYRIEVRNNGTRRARQVLITGTLPESILPGGSDRRCTISPARELTCIIFGLEGGRGEVVTFNGQLKPGFLGSFPMQMTVSLGDNQRDLEPTLNTRVHTTVVEDPGFGENAVFVPLVGD